jgi:N-ethylmaleimide reductase
MTPGIHTDAQVEGWKAVTDAVHTKGGHIFLQLWHVGRISHPSLQPDGELPVAPSAIRPQGEAFTYSGLQPFVTPRALETKEIFNIVYDYRKAASNAMEAGFDGVEVHAANGYLLDQFLRDGSNHRNDEYGGSLANRCRFLMEVLEAVIGECGSQRVGVRLSPLNSFNDMSDSDPEALFSYIVEQLQPLDLAYLHVMEGDFAAKPGSQPAFDVHKLRSIYQGRYMVNGGYDLQRGNAVLAQGDADLVSYGALYISNPDLPERFAQGAQLNTPDESTFYGGDEQGYTDYPALDTGG